MNASDLMVKCLAAAGVQRIFGVPGEENADFMIALEKSEIDFVLTRHEQGAAFMAAVHGRLTGEVGVCLGTLGPGATNLMTGVAQANMDNTPLIVITGQAGLERQHKESHQMMDVMRMMAPITKWQASVKTPETIPEIVSQAVRTATAERPGAVHIELPEDIAGQDSDGAPLHFTTPPPAVPNLDQTARVWSRIAEASSPIVIAGHGVIRSGASEELRTFAKSSGIGVLTTMMGKGAVAADDPSCLHTIGLGQFDIPDLIATEADLVVAVGYDLVEYPPSNLNATCELIHVGASPAVVDAAYQPVLELVGEVGVSLAELAECAMNRPATFDLARQHNLRDAMREELQRRPEPNNKAIAPQTALAAMRDVMGASDILISGVGAHKMWIARHFGSSLPNTCLISNGFCSMGMPLPGVIAAALACPDRKAVGLAGDGDIMMNIQEMETAARLGVDVTVVVWENESYGLIAWKQDEQFGHHTPLSFTNPDWAGLCKAFGWKPEICKAPEDFKERFKAALAFEGPALVVVSVDDEENTKLTKRLQDLMQTL
ncbi:acetolactate synthase-1/2/3 large subunit [Cognatiyoonia koreensis]|uniref:Acetolactate synthase-1/2/3 large subunit n=1 Tax=Cognatiyoonia koreensis TaxID=364200 RepID=A0A1I0PXE7_9RHOB|nr:acetolactate synthase large subunit [Cognatiyoonia koreensis]SEW19223.1 acetolactate synthase-1/2/3 large subunit [Cognatiyoonia koreensis]